MQVIKLNGDHLTFKGRVYGSVGIEYSKYDICMVDMKNMLLGKKTCEEWLPL